MSRIGHRATNAQLFNTVDQHDVAGFGFVHRYTLQALELQNLIDTAFDDFAIRTKFHNHVLGSAHAATVHTAYTDLAHVGAVVQRTDLQLQRCVDVVLTLGHMLQDSVEQRTHIAFTHVFGQTGVARQTRCVNDGEIQLFVGRAQFVEQVERGVDREVRTGAGTVNLVDHHNRTQTQFQSFASHKAGLRHGAFNRIHQQQHAVNHGQHAFDLTTKVSVTGGVDNVDVGAFVFDGTVLRQNGNTAFFLDIARVHDTFGDMFVVTERTCLSQQLIDQGGLPVVNVGNNGHIAQCASHNSSF